MIRRILLVSLLAASSGTPLLVAQDKAKAPALPQGIKVVKNLTYGPHERNKLDVFCPESPTKPLPLIVWVHGGGWQAGSKEAPSAARGFVGKGYVVANINYRLTDAAPFPAQIHDCKAAVRWLRAHAGDYGIDGDRVGVIGASAGGHLVGLLGVTNDDKELEGDVGGNGNQSSRVQAVCAWCGAFDFLNWGEPGKLPNAGMAQSAVGKLLGGAIETKTDVARQASPITHLSKKLPPFIFVHGDKDPLVPLQQSEVMHAALKKAGADSTLHVVAGGGHGQGLNTSEVAKVCADFFARTLKKE